MNTANAIVEQAIYTGELRGNIDKTLLAKMLFENQRYVRRNWMRGFISLDVYKKQLLSAAYVTLAADASTATHQVLLDKLQGFKA